MFWGTTAFIAAFVLVTLIFLPHISATFELVRQSIAATFGWFFVLSVNGLLGLCVYLLFSRHADVRIGGPDAKPEFTYWGWIAMLFSAGMGIGLVFWSVAEPVLHYTFPPIGPREAAETAERAISITLFHWGLHAWGIYSIVGLALAYFAFNRGLPLTIRSAFSPLMGKRIHGPLGDIADTVAAVATVFGLATSLGLGAQQISAGLSRVFGMTDRIEVQVVLIAVITSIATISVVLGLDRGIRRLSLLNMWLAAGLLLFVLAAGPTLFFFDALVQNIGLYFRYLPELSTWTEAYRRTDWQADWTLFYWAWWISWSPFVGMFIARISRGRTIREYIIVTLLVPLFMTLCWLTVFGNGALYVEQFGRGGLAAEVETNVGMALFAFLETYPLSFLSSVVGVMVVVIFFVTSADSASYVIGILASEGRSRPPRPLRIYWAVMMGVVAAVLLFGGGLIALRTGAISLGLPFAVVLVALCVSLMVGLREDDSTTHQAR